MSYRTRSTPWQLDTRSYSRINNGNWTFVGGGLENQTSSRTADYPDWDWRDRIRRGVSATTVLNGTRYGVSRDPPQFGGRLRVVNSAGWDPASGHMITWSLQNGQIVNTNHYYMKGKVALANLQFYTDNTLLGRVENDAIMGFRRKLAQARSYLQGTVSLGEIRETIRMLRSPMQSLRNLWTRYGSTLEARLGNRRRPLGDLNDTIRDTWLEYSFGVRPLISDLEGVAKFIVDELFERPPRKRVSFISWGYSEANGNDNVTSSYGSILVRRRRERRRHYISVKYKGAVGLEHRTTAHYLGLAGDPLALFVPTVYELIPFTWLLDYGSNLGAIVEALTTGTGDVLWMERSTLSHRDTRWSDVVFESTASPPYQWGYRHVGDIGTKYWQTISRSPYVGSLLPSFQWRVPERIGQWANVASIVHMFANQSTSIQRRNLRI